MLRAAVIALTATAVLGSASRMAWAQALMTREQAIALAFPGARTVRCTWVLTDAQAQAIEKAAQVKLRSRILSATLAARGDTLLGATFVDSRRVRTMPAVFAVAVARDTTVLRVDVLAFHEPPDYRPPERWLSLFGKRKLDDRLWPRRDIHALSGASLTTRSVTEAVRSALAAYAIVITPDAKRRLQEAPR